MEDYAAGQNNVANTRLPYASTLQMNNLVQINKEDEEDDSDDDDVQIGVAGEKVSESNVPLDFHFVHLAFEDDSELVKIENNKNIPLNFRF